MKLSFECARAAASEGNFVGSRFKGLGRLPEKDRKGEAV